MQLLCFERTDLLPFNCSPFENISASIQISFVLEMSRRRPLPRTLTDEKIRDALDRDLAPPSDDESSDDGSESDDG